jgi:hypothetical protein
MGKWGDGEMGKLGIDLLSWCAEISGIFPIHAVRGVSELIRRWEGEDIIITNYEFKSSLFHLFTFLPLIWKTIMNYELRIQVITFPLFHFFTSNLKCTPAI